MHQPNETVHIRIIYPSASTPAETSLPLQSPVREVKQFALAEFGVVEGPDPQNSGNQLVFFLYHDRTKIENLDAPISDFLHGQQHNLLFRLVREVIVG